MDVFEAITRRASIRTYRPDPVPQPKLENVLAAMREAPSACNFQPYRFVVVTDEEVRAQLALACRAQHFVARAPVVIVGCGVPDDAYKRMGGHGNSVDVDVAIAMDHMTLAAAAEGLGTCWIGAFDEPQVRRILQIPDSVRVIALSPLGFPAAPGKPHRRKPLDDLICWDKWG